MSFKISIKEKILINLMSLISKEEAIKILKFYKSDFEYFYHKFNNLNYYEGKSNDLNELENNIYYVVDKIEKLGGLNE